jgi:predicted nucleic acid-binding protein
MDAFDADVLIYAASTDPQWHRIRVLFEESGPTVGRAVGVGSLLLLPETRSKPKREGDERSLRTIDRMLDRLELLPVSKTTARIATELASTYRLQATDAVHLATGIEAGADRFITNNRRDFPKSIEEIEITYPEDLAPTTR